jgi:hypothetical protein
MSRDRERHRALMDARTFDTGIDTPDWAPALVPEEIALVEAIRRAYGSPEGYGGLEAFHVADILSHPSGRRR